MIKIEVKCPCCHWKGEITDKDLPQCPICFCDLIVVEALLELIDKTR